MATSSSALVNSAENNRNCNGSYGNLCCVNFFEVNGACKDCPNGTFGVNCSSACPQNYFGLLCQEKCNCRKAEHCDPVHGCQQNVTNCTDGRSINIIQDETWRTIAFLLLAVVILLIALIGCKFCKYRNKINVLHKRNIEMSKEAKTGTNIFDSKDFITRNSGLHQYAEIEDSNVAENELQEMSQQNSIITSDDNQVTQTSIQIEDKILLNPELSSYPSRTDLSADRANYAYTYDHIVRCHSNDVSLKVNIKQDPTQVESESKMQVTPI